MSVATAIGVTVSEPELDTYTVFPDGVIAMALGSRPTVMGGLAFPVATEIGQTVPTPPGSLHRTYTTAPSGVTAMATGLRPTLIGRPADPVPTEIGVTQPGPWSKFALATYRVFPSGVKAITRGRRPP